MKLFGKRGAPEAGGGAAPAGPEEMSASPRPAGTGFIPDWFRRAGLASWYLIGIVIVLSGLAYSLHALATLVIPTLFAILLGATFMPLVDWLERHRISRVTILIVVGAFALLGLMMAKFRIADLLEIPISSVERSSAMA